MIQFMESKERSEEIERCLDSQLWHACAGSMVQMPPVNSKVFYFPQGHFEHVCGNLDFRNCPRFPAYVLCKVSAIKFMADPEIDEVFAKIRLVPVAGNEVDLDQEGGVEVNGSESQQKPTSFAKTLTQSDANNGGGFSVPRYCAESIFPKLDYSADPPVQTILVKDVHGQVWKFRHIYRGTPRRHLLTTGWSAFVNHKKLVAGDSIVFQRAENGDLRVGIRRAKNNGTGGAPEVSSLWNPSGGSRAVQCGGFSFFREDEFNMSKNSRGVVKMDDAIHAASLAASGRSFDVVYHPRASSPEFCVMASRVEAARRIHWRSGMRFKMAFETEDFSRISWSMGTISYVQPVDPVRWPDSPWRLLLVRWDEPDQLPNMKRVNPWSIELVSNIPLFPFSPPHKKIRLPQQLDGRLPLPAFNHLQVSSYPFSCPSDNPPTGIQGARHDQYGVPLSYVHFRNLGLFPADLRPPDRASGATGPSGCVASGPGHDENISCLLTIGSSAQGSAKSGSEKEAPFMLFGQKILGEKQISMSSSSDTVSTRGCCSSVGNTSDGSGSGSVHNRNDAHERSSSELSSETGHCKVFMESEDVGRTVDLSLLGSYEEVQQRLACMFEVEVSEISNHVVYRDTTGAVRQLGEEPFSKFSKTAKRLRVVADSQCKSLDISDQI